MTAGTASGNSDILTYRLWFDDGTGTVNIILMDSLYTNFIAEGLDGGQDYIFQVQASNIYGYGDLSDPVTIAPRDIPSQIPLNSFSVANSALNVVITWSSPNSNYDDITAY